LYSLQPSRAAEFGLTKREQEVLQLFVSGYRIKATAEALGVEAVTIRVHLASLRRKICGFEHMPLGLQALELGIIVRRN
jgi:DNA-binding NarL/FixJ family response regulator